MEIFVEGVATKFVPPDQIIINMFFKTTSKNYDEALKKGINDVETFKNLVLLESDIDEKNLKTRNFSIYEERRFDEKTNKNQIIGYVFNQSTTLKTPYDNKLLSKMLTLISSLENAPDVNIQFGLSENAKVLDELINEANSDAKRKAELMAKSVNKELKDVLLLDLNGVANIQNRISESTFDSTILRTMNLNNLNTNNIYPEDIEINIKILNKWKAE